MTPSSTCFADNNGTLNLYFYKCKLQNQIQIFIFVLISISLHFGKINKDYFKKNT